MAYEPRAYLSVVKPLTAGDLKGTAFWRNCKSARRRGCKICDDCPLRREIERAEREAGE